ncbi:nucleolar protein 9-like [Mytilus californianus]|uniref:nucleolar protein 9-like n=1 Tax=Mytilus californianus TaxID=6549 RepID=UPI0022450F83|nr:nucleolar protein 9-like [Mytilus californianus]
MGKSRRNKDENDSNFSQKKERVDENTINYYRRVTETLNEGFSTDEDRELFLDNVFNQLEEDGPKVCRLASTSRVLEKLIQDAQNKNILQLLKAFSQDWIVLLSDRFGSHVLQKLICQIPRCLSKISNEEDTEDETIYTYFLNLCNFLKDNISDARTDMYASHILRVVLQVLGGVNVGEQVVRSRLSRNQDKDGQDEINVDDFSPSDKFKKVLLKFTKLILSSDTLNMEICNPTNNPLIQTVLLVLHRVNDHKCQKYLKKLICIPGLFDSNTESLPVITKDEIGSFMVEQILNLGSEEFYTELYKKLFKGKLLLYAVHPVSNFILQRLITNVKEKEHFEEIFGELCGYLEDMLAVNHLGVVTRLAEACHRLGCNQEKLLRSLKAAFHCLEPVERETKVAPLLLSLTTYEIHYDMADSEEKKENKTDKEPAKKNPVLTDINYHGSMLVQHLLKFGNPKQMVTSLLELKPVELKNLSCNPCGSHVVDAFFQSKTIGEKSREAFVFRIKGQYIDIACNKNGSRTLEMIWKHINTSQKIAIATELGKQEHKLRGDRFGLFVHKNFGIFQFVHRKKDWEESQSASLKKRKLFEEILGVDSSGNKKKKSSSKAVDNPLKLEDSDDEEEPKTKKPVLYKRKLGYEQAIPGSKKQSKEYQLKDKKMKHLLDEVTGKKKKK